jgi:isopentenyl diphosphate isomerase/L-lactate dehydrogenase-like FMN-dependent dehydrogenase
MSSDDIVPLNIKDLQAMAKGKLSKMVYEYYASGAGDETALNENEADFRKIKLMPRLYQGPSSISLRENALESTSICTPPLSSLVSLRTTWTVGEKRWALDAPFAIAPTALHALAHLDGELATSEAAAHENVCYIQSSWSSFSIEEVHGHLKKTTTTSQSSGPRWFQLYVYKDLCLCESLIQRAYLNGYSAIVITVDTPRLGKRLKDMRNQFHLPSGIELANFRDDPSNGTEKRVAEETIYTKSKRKTPFSGLSAYVSSEINSDLDWNILKYLKSISPLPIILKGILSIKDALLAVHYRFDALIVSNHGGRQLDEVPSTVSI